MPARRKKSLSDIAEQYRRISANDRAGRAMMGVFHVPDERVKKAREIYHRYRDNILKSPDYKNAYSKYYKLFREDGIDKSTAQIVADERARADVKVSRSTYMGLSNG